MRLRRLLTLLLIPPMLAGCSPDAAEPGDETQASEAPASADELRLASTAFQPGQAIPARHACTGQDLSPPLAWINLPKGTRSLTLIVDDPDAGPRAFTHWLIYNVPPEISILPEGLGMGETLSLGELQGLNDFRKPGWSGPCPPPGAPHRYIFRLYALDAMLMLPPGAPRPQIDKAMEGHILAQTRLSASFKR